jgi:hypothetical protein
MTGHDWPSDDRPSDDRPDGGWPDGGWPDGGWPDNASADDDWPDGNGWPVGEPVTPMGERRAGTGRQRVLRLAIVAVVAMAAGAAVAAAVRDLTPSAGGQPTTAPPGASQHAAGGPGGQLSPGTSGTLMLVGNVVAVSGKSITIGAGPQAVTAKVTGNTRFSGRLTGIAAVRVGDMVAAQISERNGVAVVVALQDPASIP